MITTNGAFPPVSPAGRAAPRERDPSGTDRAAAAARRLRARRDDVVEEILATLARTGHGRGRAGPPAGLPAVVRANVDAVLDAVAGGVPAREAPIPDDAVACVDGSGAGLLRAYLLGERTVLRRFRCTLREAPMSADELDVACDVVRDRVALYVDRVCTTLLEAHGAGAGTRGGRHAVTAGDVSGILDDPQVPADQAGAALGVPVDRWHLGVVAWPGSGGRPVPLPALVALLEHVLHGTVLAVPADARTAWLWVSWDDPPDLRPAELAGRLRPAAPVRLAHGQLGHGIEGFRSSHRQAVRAHRLAVTGPADVPQVVAYRAVALSALLRAHPEELDEWTRLVLGDLLRDDRPTARLRETARVFLHTGGSRTETAARLRVHRNTVRNRLAQVEDILGRPLSEDRLDTEVALQVCAQVGPAPAGSAGRPGPAPRRARVTAGTPSG